MKVRHARKIALAAALAAIGVAAVAGWVSRGYFIEEWLMRRLENGSAEEQQQAFAALCARRSSRAFRHFLEAKAKDADYCSWDLGTPEDLIRFVQEIGRDAPRVFLDALQHPDPAVRRVVMSFASVVHERLQLDLSPFYERALRDENEDVRLWAASGLVSSTGAPGAAITAAKALVKGLSHPSAATRIACMEALWDLQQRTGVRADGALEPLKQILRYKNPDVRRSAAATLAGINEERAIIDSLQDSLIGEKDPKSRSAGFNAKLSLAKNASETLQIVAEEWKDPDCSIRAEAIGHLVSCKEVPLHEALAFLFCVFEEETHPATLDAVRSALCHYMSPKPEAFVGAFRARDASFQVRFLRWFLPLSWCPFQWRLHPDHDPHEVTKFFIAVLHDPDRDIRSLAASALLRTAWKIDLSVSEIARMLKSREGNLRRLAIEHLQGVGYPLGSGGRPVQVPLALEAPPLLAEALKDEDPEVRRRAAQLLVDPEVRMHVLFERLEWQGMAPEVLAALEAALQDSDAGTRISAAVALLYREQSSEKARAVIAEGLGHRQHSLRCYTLREMARIENYAEPARSLLEKALQDPSPEVRELSRQVLEKMKSRTFRF
jgi:HEAT repeat protein